MAPVPTTVETPAHIPETPIQSNPDNPTQINTGLLDHYLSDISEPQEAIEGFANGQITFDPETQALILTKGQIKPETTDTSIPPEQVIQRFEKPGLKTAAQIAMEKSTDFTPRTERKSGQGVLINDPNFQTEAIPQSQPQETPQLAPEVQAEQIRVQKQTVAEVLHVSEDNIDIQVIEAMYGGKAITEISQEDLAKLNYDKYREKLNETLEERDGLGEDETTQRVEQMDQQRATNLENIRIKETYGIDPAEAQVKLDQLLNLKAISQEQYDSLKKDLDGKSLFAEDFVSQTLKIEQNFIIQKSEQTRRILAEKMGLKLEEIDSDLAYAFTKTILDKNPNDLSLEELAEKVGKSTQEVETEILIDVYADLIHQQTYENSIKSGNSEEVAKRQAQLAKNKWVEQTPFFKEKQKEMEKEQFYQLITQQLGQILGQQVNNTKFLGIVEVVDFILNSMSS